MTPRIKPKITIHNTSKPIKIDGTVMVQTILTDQHCPICGKLGNWRMGQEFEHQMRCPSCSESDRFNSIVWEPGSLYLKIQTIEKKIPVEITGLCSTGDITMQDMAIIENLANPQDEDIPHIQLHNEGATIDLQPTHLDPQHASVEIKLQNLAFEKSGLSQKALNLIALARNEKIDKLKLDGIYTPIYNEIDPSWT